MKAWPALIQSRKPCLSGMGRSPVVLAKMIADLAVFGVGQLFLLRYVVFPVAREPEAPVPAVRLEKADVRGSAARAA